MSDAIVVSTPFPASSVFNEVMAALSKAQAAFPPIGKDKSARIQTRGGAAYSYDYADLATILAAVRKPLTDQGLVVFQPLTLTGDRVSVLTVLGHTSGQWLSSALEMPVADPSDPRAVASAITYARRYSLIALIGVAPAAEDDDGEAAQASRPTAPETVIDAHTGEEVPASALPAAPTGYAYINSYAFKNGWHDVVVEVPGHGRLRLSTKTNEGNKANEAYRAGLPVKVAWAPKKPPKSGEGYLNGVTIWKAPGGDGELYTEPVDESGMPIDPPF